MRIGRFRITVNITPFAAKIQLPRCYRLRTTSPVNLALLRGRQATHRSAARLPKQPKSSAAAAAAAILICRRRLGRPYTPSASPQAQDDDAGVSSSSSIGSSSRQPSGRLASSLGLVFLASRGDDANFDNVIFQESIFTLLIPLCLSSSSSPTTTSS